MNYLRLLTCATAVGALCSYPAVAANGNPNQNSSQPNSEQTAPQKPQAPRSQVHQKLNRSRLASDLLRDTDQARRAIASNNKDQASQSVNQALNVASRLRSSAANNGNHSLVPIYTEWESTSVIGPVVVEQNAHRNSSNPQAQNQAQDQSANQPGTQNGQSTAQPGTAEAVRKVTGSLTSIGLDPQMAYTHLQAAKSALAQSKLQRADSALAAVQDSVLLQSYKSDLPLLKARQNLALACQAIQNGNDTEASAALQNASSGLDEYANAFSSSNASQAEQLGHQINSYANKITNSQPNIQTAQNRVQNWWNQVSGLMRQPAQNNQPQG